MSYEPKRGDQVRIGPADHPRHEWVGNFVCWTIHRSHFVVDNLSDGKRWTVRAETLRGPA